MGLITQKIESTNLNTCNAKTSCDAERHKKNNVGIVLGKNNNEIGDSFQNNAANVEQNEALEDKKNSKLKKGLIIGGAILATVAIAIGATYLIKQKRSKTHEDYVLEVEKINPNIEVIGEYINTNTKILHKCKIDGFHWYVEPSHVLLGYNCPICAKISQIILPPIKSKISKFNLLFHFLK